MRAVGSKEMLAAAASFLLFHRAFGGLPLVKVTRKLVGKETLKSRDITLLTKVHLVIAPRPQEGESGPALQAAADLGLA